MITLNGTEIEFFTFPNGETGLKHENINENMIKIDGTDMITFKYTDDGDLIKLLLLKDYLDFITDLKFDLVITHMPYGRMDRSENFSPFTLKTVSKLINSMGFNTVTIFEPHSDVTCALVDNSRAIHLTVELLPTVMEEIGFNKELDYVFFPDAGASKRYKNLTGFKQLIGHKKRDFETGEIKGLQVIGEIDSLGMLEEHPPKVLIVDDLTSRGGTFVHSAKALRALGFEEVYLLVAHAENTVFKGELFDHIDKLFTTNSMITEQNNWENQKFASQLKIYELEGVLS